MANYRTYFRLWCIDCVRLLSYQHSRTHLCECLQAQIQSLESQVQSLGSEVSTLTTALERSTEAHSLELSPLQALLASQTAELDELRSSEASLKLQLKVSGHAPGSQWKFRKATTYESFRRAQSQSRYCD